ncbi:hypothetical protein JNUCC42_17885 [Brevibacterium sp. JNUCC-42]|nr:hypothetical protein JNUCC42_17885 [Brevibacterium sp. JNUCC-42]
MKRHQQFLHLRLNENEILTEQLGTTIREMEKSLPSEKRTISKFRHEESRYFLR